MITHGFNVTLVEVTEDLAEKAKQTIRKNIERLAQKKFQDDQNQKDAFVQNVIGRLSITSNLKASVKSADLVIEAIIENLDAKHAMFAVIDKVRCIN